MVEGCVESRSVTRKVDVVDVLHGRSIADPFRWLEDAESAEVRAWTDEQNARTRAVLDRAPGRARIEKLVRDLLRVGFVSAPAVRVGPTGERRYFYQKRTGEQNQPLLYVRDGHAGEPRVLLDPATLSEDATSAVDWWYPSRDGRLVAWGRSESGSEQSVLHVRDVASGADLVDRIPHTRHASVAWRPDGASFFYSRYPAPGTVPPGDEAYHCRIYEHVLGRDPAEDALVFGEGRDKTDIPIVFLSPDGRWLLVQVHQGWDKSEMFVCDLQKAGARSFTRVTTGERALYEPIVRDDALYVRTNEGAPRYRLLRADWRSPERGAWREIVPEEDDVLEDVAIVGETIVATYLHHASTRLARFDLAGRPLGALELPQIGSAAASGPWEGGEVFVTFTSFVVPWRVYRVELGAANAQGTIALRPDDLWETTGTGFEVPEVAVSQIFATSKDGTRVPMFVVEGVATRRDGATPTVLWGYGGFNVNQTPAFSARALTTVACGGVWVSAILRGGGEYGEAWHRAGMLERKQNVFDDFYACMDELVRAKVTSPEHLAIAGGSNGGLLTAVAVTQRPHAFRAALSLVPLCDMIRYHLFRIGRLWIPEYGSSEDPEQLEYLLAYSPYHHVVDGTRYPAVLFATAESDSRVDPMHARKMAARMQQAQAASDRPILLRVETKAGHGAGKPIHKVADELVDELSFVFEQIGLPR
jgi:prolyl oligopeptidase